jgi:flagella basal body P-ring formation protein FlgA
MMNRFRRFLSCVLFASVLVHPARRASGGESAVFQLLPEAKVDAAGILLNQIVRSSVHATLPTLRLAPAPLLGQTIFLSRQQIIALAAPALPALDSTNWIGPDSVRVSRQTRPLAEAELLDLLRAALQRDYAGSNGALEIHLTRPWPSTNVPVEPLSLQITDLPPAGILPNLVAGFELWSGTERLGAWQWPLQARLWRDLPVAHSPLLRGQLLRDADITLERRDTLAQREACISFPVTDNWLETVSSVQAGTPIWARLVRSRPVLRRGQLVDALYREGSLSISLKVETLEDGALGQTVRVRNPKTRRELYGKIQTQDLVLIAL